jgi:nicotinamidase/pyrazinamidase
MGRALLVIDVQIDFCPGGALAVPRGDEVVAVCNRLAATLPHVVLTADWHPAGHGSFASSHSSKAPYETATMAYGEQVLWPDHCIQGTPGARFHPDLDTRRACAVVRKGMNPAIDSYSAFFENDKRTPTGLEGLLASLGVQSVAIVGLATDFCVLYTALDATRVGLEVAVVEDGVRGIDLDGSLASAWQAMAAAGVVRTTSEALAQG